MKLNKNCPHYEDCGSQNERMDEIWRYGCLPQYLKKKPKFNLCQRYEEWERYGHAIRDDDGASG